MCGKGGTLASSDLLHFRPEIAGVERAAEELERKRAGRSKDQAVDKGKD